jgi:hypothetical protein
LEERLPLEGLTKEQLEEYESILLHHVPENGTIGNVSLLAALGWDEDLYWTTRNRLIEQGLLIQGRGRGGSVRRVPKVVPVLSTEAVSLAPEINHLIPEQIAREADLYPAMFEVIQKRWAKERRLDNMVVEVTAAQGSKQTKGKWTRPDITIAGYKTFPYVPGRHFDITTFTVIYEALGHRRAANRSYALIHVPDDQRTELDAIIEDICMEAKRVGVGVIVAAKADDYDTWEELVEAVRHEPDPERLNDFLAVQVSQGFREQIIRWFK